MLDYFRYGNALSLSAYWKMIFSFVGAFFASLAGAFPDGITIGEIFVAVQVASAAAGLTWFAPPNQTA